MSNQEALSPLLIELARAVRARSFFDDGHATREHAMAKAKAVWAAELSRSGELDLEVCEDGFRSPQSDSLQGASLGELAAALRRHQVIGLQIHPSLSAAELETLVDLIATDPTDVTARGGFSACLREAGVKYAAVWEIPSPSSPSPKPRTDSGHVTAPTLDERTIQDDDTQIQRMSGAPELQMPQGDASELTVRLVHELAGLEPCDELGEYRLVANRVDGHIDRLLAMKNHSDAYRAALLFSRHGSDPNRSEAIRKEAVDHLRSLFRDEGMIDQLVRASLGREGLKTIQAVQILASLAPTAVSRLLIEHTKGDRQTQDGVASVLIAMGEGVIPVLADEMDSESPGRARRAAKILGDLQHPAGVVVLSDHLRSGDANLRREIAQSLARIGSPEAIDFLAGALEGQGDLAMAALNGLSYCRGSQAIQVLVGVIRREKDYSEELRREAIRGLGRIRDPLGVPTLREILDRDGLLARRRQRPLRLAAAQSLARIADEEAIQALQVYASGGDASIAKACSDLLGNIESRSSS